MNRQYFKRIDARLVAPMFLDKVEDLLDSLRIDGHDFVVTCGYRSGTQQAQLYSQGRSKPGRIVTNAKPFESLHQFGLAVDLVRLRDGKYSYVAEDFAPIGEVAKSLGLTWGGEWKMKDLPHVQPSGFLAQSSLEPLRRAWNVTFCQGMPPARCLEECWRAAKWA